MAGALSDLKIARGLDYGGGGPSSKPGAVLWGCAFADGHAHIFDEFKSQRMTVKQIAEEIRARDKHWGLKGLTTWADPSLQINSGQVGESIAATFARYKVPLSFPSNDRLSGWQRVHEALAPCHHPHCINAQYPEGRPWLSVHPRCKYLIRTIPLMVQDETNPEDLDTDSDDHACDALRYLLMGGLRPGQGKKVKQTIPVGSLAWYRSRFPDQPSKDAKFRVRA